MVERGQLDIDRDINEYLSWSQEIRHPRYPAIAITPRMLMTHTSSLLPDAPVLYKNNWGWAHDLPSYAPEGVASAVGNPSCPLENLEDFLQDLLFGGNDSGVGGDRVKDWNALADEDGGIWNRYAPGKGREYSNIGTALLGVVLQKASGSASIERLFQDALFRPLGMTSTSWFMDGVQDFNLRASKHYTKAGTETNGLYCFIDYPSGSLRTTAKDLASFMRVVARDGIMDDGVTRLYSPQVAAELSQCQQPPRTVSKRKPCQNSYHWFLGDNFADTWYQKKYNRLKRKEKQVCNTMEGGMFHDGSELGTGSFVAAVPDKQAMVVLLTNGEDGWELAERALFDAILRFSKIF